MAVLESRRIFIAAAVLALAALVAVIAGAVSHRSATTFGANGATEGSIAVVADNVATEGSLLPHDQGG